MALSKAFIPVIAAFFTVFGALAADPPAYGPAGGPGYGYGHGPGHGRFMGPDGCRGVMRFLTPQQRAMHFRASHGNKSIGDMTLNQLREWRDSQCKKFMAMSVPDRQKYAVQMQAKWDALSDAEKVKIYEQMHKYRDGRGRGHGRHGHGMGGGW